MAMTLVQAQEQLDAWLNASIKCAAKQEYTIGDRRLSYADAGEIRQQVEFWEKRVAKLARGGISIKGATPV